MCNIVHVIVNITTTRQVNISNKNLVLPFLCKLDFTFATRGFLK